MNFFKNPNYDFVRWRWHAIILSLIIVIARLTTVCAIAGVSAIFRPDARRSASSKSARASAESAPTCSPKR